MNPPDKIYVVVTLDAPSGNDTRGAWSGSKVAGLPSIEYIRKEALLKWAKEKYAFITDALSQILDDIAGNPDWQDAARALAADIWELERELKEMVKN